MSTNSEHQSAEMWHNISRRLALALRDLDRAAETQNGIAGVMCRLGYLGAPFESGDDPISHYLRVVSCAERVVVSESGGNAFHSECPIVPFRVSATLAQFILDYDSGYYPQLFREPNNDERETGQLPVTQDDGPTASAGLPDGVQQGD